MQKEIEFIVNADGVCLCGGSKRPQLAGVQGDDRICTVKYDLSAVYTDNAKYFVEIVTGNNEPLQFSEDSEIVTLDTESKVLSIIVDNVISQDGSTVEINIVEEVLDSEFYTTKEGNTYTSYIYFQPKAKEIVKKKKTLYGMVAEILEKVKAFTQRVLRIETKFDVVESRINKNETDILRYSKQVEANKENIKTNQSRLDNHDNHISRLQKVPGNINCWVDWISNGAPFIRITFDVIQEKEHYTNLTFKPTTQSEKWQVLYLRFDGTSYSLTLERDGDFFINIAICQFKFDGNIITEFLPFGLENIYENYILPIKTDIEEKQDKITQENIGNYFNPYHFRYNEGIDVIPFSEDEFSGFVQGQDFKSLQANVTSNNTRIDALELSKQDKLTIDDSLSSVSENPIQNKVVSNTFDSFNENIERNSADIANLKTNDRGQNIQITNLFTQKQDKLTVSSTLSSTLVQDTIYNLGSVSSALTIAFPSVTNDYIGSVIYINFECSSAITLTLDTSNTTAIDIVPESNKGYEIFGSWNGTRWVLGYDEYDIPVSTASDE